MMKKKIENKHKIRIFFWLLLVIFLCFLAYSRIVPFGDLELERSISEKNKFISDFSPNDRVADDDRMIGDPVYFTLSTARPFDTVKLSFDYRNDSARPIIQAGILADKLLWRYQLIPVENRIIDSLSRSWIKLEDDNGILLLQRPVMNEDHRIYRNIDDFLNDPPNIDKIASFNYQIDSNYKFEQYQPLDSQIEYLYEPIRGDYQFYVYVGGEDMDLNFEITDINQNNDIDSVSLNLYYQNRLLGSSQLDDDGISDDSGRSSEKRYLHFNMPNMPSGAYKFEFRANDDIVTHSIKGKFSKLSFINKIWIYNTNYLPGVIYTNARSLKVRTSNPKALQNIQIENNGALNISETYKQFQTKLVGTSSIFAVNFEKGDFILEGLGVFTFQYEQFIDPVIHKLDEDTNIDSIDYIIADYQEPMKTGSISHASVTFDLRNAYFERIPDRFGGNYNYGFMISVPGLLADDNITDSIAIDNIKIRLEGKTIFEKIKEMFTRQLKN